MDDCIPQTADRGQIGGASDILRRFQERSPFPLAILLALTGRCNATCAHCEQAPTRNDDPDMTTEQVIALLSELKRIGVLAVAFTGGEPTLRKDLAAIIKAATSYRFYSSLKTNGARLTDEDVDRVIAAGLSSINISLYHCREERHDAFVGIDGAFGAALAAARRLLRHRVRVSISIAAMGWNIDSVPELIERCRREGFYYTIDTKIAPGPKDAGRAPRHQADPVQIKRLYESVPELSPLSSTENRRGSDDVVCQVGRGTGYINYNGDVWPCARIPVLMGNVLEAEFAEIWRDSPVRKRLASIRFGDLPKCNECEISGGCSHCLSFSFDEKGELVPPDNKACAVAEAVAGIARQSRGDAPLK